MRKSLLMKVFFGVILVYLTASCGGGGGGGLLIPAAPGGVQIVVGDGFVTLSWAAAQGATSYTLYMASAPGVTKANYSGKPDGMKHANATSPYTHTGLTNGKTYYFVVTASNSAGESGESQEASATHWPPGLLQGPPNEPANSHIPDIPITDPPPEDIVAPAGIPISVRDLLVNFQDSASVGQVNSLIQSLPAGIAGGLPSGKLLLLRLTGNPDLAAVLSAQATLLASPLVVAASINIAVAPDQLPPHNVHPVNNQWTWEVPSNWLSGNWGLKAIRMPQAWNLVDLMKRKDWKLDAAVLEADEKPGNSAIDPAHPDLQPKVISPIGVGLSNHATMVGGIIGAVWNNNKGVEGVYPNLNYLISRPINFAGSLEATIIDILSAPDPLNVVVINYSAGHSGYFEKEGIDPVTALVNLAAPAGPGNPTWRNQTDAEGNVFLTTMRNWETGPTGRSSFLMFCAAGNLRLRPGTALEYEVRDESDCANVAVRGANPDPAAPLPGGGAGADHFLAVESMDSAGNRSTFSASGGTLSAPGECVRSAELNDADNFDKCYYGSDSNDQEYATSSGTSFSTPYATGLAAYLWSLDSTLIYQQMRQILTAPANRVPVPAGPLGGAAGSPRVDAFSALMGIDVFHGNKELQKALVDVDDGTPDGNQRTFRSGDGTYASEFTGIPTPAGDNRRGDDKISAADFRVFRDAMTRALLENGDLQSSDVSLDGSPTHFKKDLNFDGCVGNQPANPAHPTGIVPVPSSCTFAPFESDYSRYDFNGDGKVSNDKVGGASGFPAFRGNEWTDLDVFKDLWPEGNSALTEGWTKNDLDWLMPPPMGAGSADIEFRSSIPLGGTNRMDEIRISISGLTMTRTLNANTSTLVWTVPISLNPVNIVAEGVKGDATVESLCFNAPPILKIAEDTVVTIVRQTDTGSPIRCYELFVFWSPIGTVTSVPAGINCGIGEFVCRASFPQGSQVTLTATPAPGYVFAGWDPPCVSVGTNPCTITMNQSLSTRAYFRGRWFLSVVVGGRGSVVTPFRGEIDCGSGGYDCSENYADGYEVTLAAYPDVGETFLRWEGGCSGTNPECTLKMDADKQVTARFTSPMDIYVSVIGNGTITSDTGGINCGMGGNICQARYPYGTVVTLTATPGPGETFSLWENACSGTSPTCTLTMDALRFVNAYFSAN